MLADRVTGTLVIACLAFAGCGSSENTAEPASTDSVADSAAEAETSPTEPTTTEVGEPTAETETEAVDEDGDIQMFPDVIDATATFDGSAWTVAATLSSPYDTPERYADAWRVVGPDGTVFGERILTHDHASEQPFTRSQSGIEIPDDVTTVTIEGRDQQFGYGGETFELTLPR